MDMNSLRCMCETASLEEGQLHPIPTSQCTFLLCGSLFLQSNNCVSHLTFKGMEEGVTVFLWNVSSALYIYLGKGKVKYKFLFNENLMLQTIKLNFLKQNKQFRWEVVKTTQIRQIEVCPTRHKSKFLLLQSTCIDKDAFLQTASECCLMECLNKPFSILRRKLKVFPWVCK